MGSAMHGQFELPSPVWPLVHVPNPIVFEAYSEKYAVVPSAVNTTPAVALAADLVAGGGLFAGTNAWSQVSLRMS
jgi:hypothetical protein